MINDIKILPVGAADRKEVIAYVLEARKQLFPMLDHRVLPCDLRMFIETYIETATGVFLQARMPDGQIVGTIGMMAYDHRFPQLSFTAQKIVEVVKLFVEPAYRRSGLATRLVQELKKIGHWQGVEVWYLHTHHFLEGACDFWLKQGFDLVLSCEESGFETLHMAMDKTRVKRKVMSDSFTNNQ